MCFNILLLFVLLLECIRELEVTWFPWKLLSICGLYINVWSKSFKFLAWYNSHTHTLYLVFCWVDDVLMWFQTLQLKANGESFVLRASWSIYSGYERRFWKIWRGASARMPLHAMVPGKTNCRSSLPSATTIGYKMWDQDKGLLLSQTLIQPNHHAIPCMPISQ